MLITKNEAPETPGADVQALTDLTLRVFRLNGVLLQWGDRLVEPLGLNSARWQMLGAIALAHKPVTAPQVGSAMGVTRQGAQKQINLLLEQGLVASRANPAHRRSPVYELTPLGRQLYLQAETLWAAQVAQLITRIPMAQAQAANTTLEAMLRHLDPSQHTNEESP